MTAKTSVSVTRIADLVERSDGLYEFKGETLQQHIAVFLEIDSKVNSAQWALAAICASITTKYGNSDVETFAREVRRSPQHVWKMARTYRLTIEKSLYSENLTFSHHAEAMRHPDPAEALAVAADNDMSSMALGEWVTEEAKERVRKPQPRAKAKRENAFREFLERVDRVILTDFMETCPNQEWGKRVFKIWREEIVWELSQIEKSEARERVLDAINEGAQTLTDIRQKTGLKSSEVEQQVSRLVKENLFEWVREGGETEVARGTRRHILHRIGEPIFV